jgi:hypothetical protein
VKNIEWTQLRRVAALGCVLLSTACGSEPGTPEQGEPFPGRQSNEPSASPAEQSAPPPVVEEPGVALAPMGTLFDSRSVVTQVMTAPGDEYATHQEVSMKGKFRPDLMVEVDSLRTRVEVGK